MEQAEAREPEQDHEWRNQPRFELHHHYDEWAAVGLLSLGSACEHRRLTEKQAAAVLELASGGDVRSFAEKRGCSLRTARKAVESAAGKLGQHVRFEERRTRYWREIQQCMEAETGGERARPLQGLLPWINTESQSLDEFKATLRQPRNYRTVSLRGELVSVGDLAGMSASAFLQELPSYVSG